MGFILPVIASALANKVLGGDKEQPQAPVFQFQPRQRNLMAPVNYRGANLPNMRLTDNPIMAAFAANDPNAPEETPKDKTKPGAASFKDNFLQSLTQGLVQRILFGGQQQQFTYAPPTFR